ncbi:MAG: metallophosphoesterase [Candidatus Methanomethylicia archaeon]
MTTKIFFSVDVHGSTLVWRKWIKAHEIHKPDVLILAGDLTGKVLVPIVEQSDGTYSAKYFGKKWTLKKEDEIKEFESRLENSGVYFIRITKNELEELKNDPEKVKQVIFNEMRKRLKNWLDILISHVDTKKVLTVVMPGNDDELIIDDIIKEYEDRGVIYPLDKIFEIAGYEVISSPYVNPTPWNTPRELSEGLLEKHLEKLISKLKAPEKSIFNFHCPPYGTHLDLAPKLTKDLKPIIIAGLVEYEHVGSKSIKKIIEKYKPILGLHGHIHESGGFDYIGKTLILNPGSEYSEGVLKAYIIELDKDGVKNFWRLEG